MGRTRVLVAYQEDYRAYRETIAAGVRLLRPRVEVHTASPTEVGAELERFDPQVVVCGVPGLPDPGRTPAWVELHAGVGRPARVRVGDRRREAPGLRLEGLLGVVDEAEALVRAREGRAGDRGPRILFTQPRRRLKFSKVGVVPVRWGMRRGS